MGPLHVSPAGRTDLEEGELLVRGGLAEADAEVRRDRVDNLVGTATAEHARSGRANLDKVVSDRFPARIELAFRAFVRSGQPKAKKGEPVEPARKGKVSLSERNEFTAQIELREGTHMV